MVKNSEIDQSELEVSNLKKLKHISTNSDETKLVQDSSNSTKINSIQDFQKEVEFLMVGNNYPQNVVYEHLARYFFASSYVENKAVLDLACGSGYGSYYCIKVNARRVFGFDINSKIISYAQNRYKHNNLVFEKCDALQINLPDSSIDVVLSFETIEHLSNGIKFLLEISRVITNDGILIISTPNKEFYSPITEHPSNPFHKHEFFIDEFETMLKSFFENVEMYGQHFDSSKIDLKKKSILVKMPELEHNTIIDENFRIKQLKNQRSFLFLAVCTKIKKQISEDELEILSLKLAKIHYENLAKLFEKNKEEDPLDLLLFLYYRRPDLKSMFPEVKSGDYTGLLEWAKKVCSGSSDSSAKKLEKFSKWFQKNELLKLEHTLENLQNKENQISNMNKEVQIKNSELKNLSNNISNMNKEVQIKNSELKNLSNNISNMNKELQIKNSELKNYKKELDTIKSSFVFKTLRKFDSLTKK